MDFSSKSMISTEERLIQYLDENGEEFLRLWLESVIVHEKDINKDRVRENGYTMYLLVKRLITHPEIGVEVKKLAYKVAKERVESNGNIGEFVYNVNSGRSTTIKSIYKSGISMIDLQPIIDKIHHHFDLYCYHAVTRYTELKDLELKKKMLFINQSHNDRLSLLGQMSSSFVHEFRNPLTSVIGFVKLLKTEYPSLKYLDTIEHELDQLKFRITQFLHASRLEVVDKEEEIEMEDLLSEILTFLYPSIVDGDVDVKTTVDSTCKIIAVKDEIKQVLVNIILNSIDALKHNASNKKLAITCENKQHSIVFTISNNGPKIPEEMKEAIFEPFYTTKSLGTGIGLYVCKTLIEKHEGMIHCESNDQNTSFIIHLPMG